MAAMQSQSQSQSLQTAARGLFGDYPGLPGTYDEMFDEAGRPRPPFARVAAILDAMRPDDFARAQALAESALLQQGVTFSVYGDSRGTEKIFPFCLLPRLVSGGDFAKLERGLVQRLRALQMFLDDIYGDQKILGTIPADMVLGAAGYRPLLRGLKPAGGVRIHISGVDLIRDPDGTWRVLEDNLRTPSGVSYVVENRLISKRLFPRVFDAARVHRVDHYPTRLAETLRSVSPTQSTGADGNAVVLTPGPYNSAYFEHSFLARTMGLELVQAPDLFVDGDKVYCRTTRAVLARLSSASTSPRDCSAVGGVASLSNSEIVPSGRRVASCWNAKLAPGSMRKSLRLPPRRHSTAPVRLSIS